MTCPECDGNLSLRGVMSTYFLECDDCGETFDRQSQEKIDRASITCPKCHLPPTSEGHDPCVADLPGVAYACCGHGKSESYIAFANGKTVRGFRLDHSSSNMWGQAKCRGHLEDALSSIKRRLKEGRVKDR